MDKLGGVGHRHHPLPFSKIPPNFGPHGCSWHHVPLCGPSEYTVWDSKPFAAFCDRENVFAGWGAPDLPQSSLITGIYEQLGTLLVERKGAELPTSVSVAGRVARGPTVCGTHGGT